MPEIAENRAACRLLTAAAMKTILRFASVAMLLGTAACGGLVEGSSSAPSSDDGNGRTPAPADSTPSAFPPAAPANGPSTQGPSGPETGPMNDLHSIAKSADEIVIRYGVLGEARPNPADECSPSDYEYRIDRRTWLGTAKICYETATDGHSTLFVTTSKTLTTTERTYIEEELMKLEVGPMPATCVYDGPAYEVELIGQTKKPMRYWDEDYNCQHNANVEYVTRSFGELRSRVHSILLPGG
jgi:hypothetical protein